MIIRKRVVIVHGAYGHPGGNWFPWLKQEIEKAGHEAVVPKFPTPEGQDFSVWQKVFEKEVGPLTRDVILVGHSVGAGFILGLLDEAGKELGVDRGGSEVSAGRRSADVLPVKAAFLVAGFLGKLNLPDFDGINETFVCRKFDWTKIKQTAAEIFVWNGEDDPYVPTEKGQQLAQSLSVPMMLIPAGGHLNEESGYTTFPLLFEKITTLLE